MSHFIAFKTLAWSEFSIWALIWVGVETLFFRGFSVALGWLQEALVIGLFQLCIEAWELKGCWPLLLGGSKLFLLKLKIQCVCFRSLALAFLAKFTTSDIIQSVCIESFSLIESFKPLTNLKTF